MFSSAFKQLSGGTMKQMFSSSVIGDTVSVLMKRVQQHSMAASAFENMRPAKYTKALESYANAVTLADSLLEKKGLTLLPEHRRDLSEVYSQYALAINNYGTSKLHLAHAAIKKSLDLDKTNATANSLSSTLHVDEIVEKIQLK